MPPARPDMDLGPMPILPPVRLAPVLPFEWHKFAERVEQAPEARFTLDVEFEILRRGRAANPTPAPYSTCVAAIVGAVREDLPGWHWRLDGMPGGAGWAHLRLVDETGRFPTDHVTAAAVTPELALLAACAKARAMVASGITIAGDPASLT